MNCAEFIGILKAGQPILFRRHSKEYIRIAENSLSVITGEGTHTCLWLAANRKFKRIIRSVSPSDKNWKIDTIFLLNFREVISFLCRWEEMRQARHWASMDNFPGLNEIATFVYLTLVPEYWKIYLEVEGKLEEAIPLIEHENVHRDNGDYDEL